MELVKPVQIERRCCDRRFTAYGRDSDAQINAIFLVTSIG